MVAKNIMASFGQGFVQTQIMSENNAVKYKLSLAGSNKNSTGAAFCTLNDKDLGSQVFQTGLNIIVFDASTNQIVDKKYFDLKNAGGAPQAFLNYMNGLSTDLVVMMLSSYEMGSTAEIDAWFLNAGSKSWPGTSRLTKFPTSSYAAIYLSKEKAICTESSYMNDGILVEDSKAYVEAIYDKREDIGGNGFSARLINDANTYSSDQGYEYKRYPTDALTTPISNIGSGTKIMFFSADLFASKQLMDDGLTTRITLRWLNDNNVLSSTVFETIPSEADVWVRKNIRITVPVNATAFTIIATRYPQGSTSTGVSSVRNVILSRISKHYEQFSRDSEIGVNGIRSNEFYDESSSYILELVDTGTDATGNIYGSDFREFSR